MIKFALAGLSIAFVTATTAAAHDVRPIGRAQAEQLSAIEQGHENGQLTRREYRDLVAEQARIADLRRQAERDGRLTGREVRSIRHAQHDAAHRIAAERHDRQVNIWRRWKARH
jgi:hypothetical protein